MKSIDAKGVKMMVIRAYEDDKLKRMKITDDPKVVKEFSEKYDDVEYVTSTYFYEKNLKERG